jgi:hypothetical protein
MAHDSQLVENTQTPYPKISLGGRRRGAAQITGLASQGRFPVAPPGGGPPASVLRNFPGAAEGASAKARCFH